MDFFSYDEESNYWDFMPGSWWKVDEVPTTDNLTFSSGFDFEKNVDYTAVHHWFQDNWWYSIAIAAVYVVLVFGGQAYMKNRERYTLQKPLIVWNLLLAGFSIFGCIRIWQVCFELYWRHGVKGTICKTEYGAFKKLCNILCARKFVNNYFRIIFCQKIEIFKTAIPARFKTKITQFRDLNPHF